jgi:peptide/nickel transport system substrate-binding protein
MVANPYFYLGKPKLSQVIYKILPDENTMETQIQTHEIDMLGQGTGLKWPHYAELAADPASGLLAIRVNSFQWSHVDFNLKHPIVSDRQVRVALAYATNRDEIIDKILHGSAIKGDTDQHPLYSWAYTTNVTHYGYDPAKARSILEADGWKPGPDGIRVKDGQKLARGRRAGRRQELPDQPVLRQLDERHVAGRPLRRRRLQLDRRRRPRRQPDLFRRQPGAPRSERHDVEQ